MHKRKLSSNDALWFGEWQLGRINIEEQSYDRKVKALSAEMALKHGMSDAPPVLTKALEALLRTHVVAVHMEMMGHPPPNFPSGQIPVLMEHLPPDANMSALLSALRATAEQLVAEDNREISQRARLCAKLRREP